MQTVAAITCLYSICHVIVDQVPRPNMAVSVWPVILLLSSCSVRAINAPSGLVPMAKYQVNLDQTPKERWIPILKDFTGSVPLILEYFRSLVRAEPQPPRCLVY